MDTNTLINSAEFHPVPGSPPRHIGIIPDGGRRWAKAHDCSLQEAYGVARSKLQEFVSFILDRGVQEISIYLSSIQNFRREADELDANLDIVESSMAREIAMLAEHRNLKVVMAGNRDILPETFQHEVSKLEQKTKNNTSGRLNFLIAYDPIEEIVQAIKASEAPEKFFTKLWVTTPVDFIVRSGKAPVMSNFLPIQSGYARLYFFGKLFNDLTLEDIICALENFSTIERKYGD